MAPTFRTPRPFFLKALNRRLFGGADVFFFCVETKRGGFRERPLLFLVFFLRGWTPLFPEYGAGYPSAPCTAVLFLHFLGFLPLPSTHRTFLGLAELFRNLFLPNARPQDARRSC